MRGLFGAAPPPVPEPSAPPSAASTAAAAVEAAPGPLGAFEALAALAAPEDAHAAAAFGEAVASGIEGPAIDVGRGLLARAEQAGRAMPELRLRIAELAFARGDDAAAEALVGPLLEADGAALPAWMLGAELAERRGDRAAARALYERVVARDVSFPRARERAQRLREAGAVPTRDRGATLVSDAASTRRFRLREELGRGGAGTVFLADEPALRRQVALKVYHRRGRTDRERLLAEARSAASFSHPGIIRILDVDEGLSAIVMEPLPLGSLKARKERGAGAEEVRACLASLVRALAEVHRAGIVHGDLKPSNCLVRAPGQAVLTDFGLARPLGGAPREAGEGTLAYMSPEQRAGAAADPAMDRYALGVVLGELAPDEGTLALGRALTRVRPEERPPLAAVLAHLERT
jgi:serine/threonine-protein kinase